MRASDRAYRSLREAILDGKLAAGTVLAEVEWAQRLGVSRTPLREALSRLVADGLVSASDGRGLEVAEFSTEHIAELYELREALEEHAAKVAAVKRDPAVFKQLKDRFEHASELLEEGADGIHRYYDVIADFDDAIDATIDNAYLSAALRNVRTHSARVRRLAATDPARLRKAAEEHLLICEAIIDGDVALARHATSIHLHMSLKNALATIAAQQSPLKENIA
ncbi:MAG TPA: GntR family transcriptional regulator [Microbacteriaceae bacterium]|nr:GntR family transcriptional regulator [Microbacteriaceae bacterium]